jgi:hypothetical protein
MTFIQLMVVCSTSAILDPCPYLPPNVLDNIRIKTSNRAPKRLFRVDPWLRMLILALLPDLYRVMVVHSRLRLLLDVLFHPLNP